MSAAASQFSITLKTTSYKSAVLHRLQHHRQSFHWRQTIKTEAVPVWLHRTTKHLLQWCKPAAEPRREAASRGADMRGQMLQNKLVVNNSAGRWTRVALRRKRSQLRAAVSLCGALPPQPSARGRKSTFSLDPWRLMNTKLYRENTNAQVGC